MIQLIISGGFFVLLGALVILSAVMIGAMTDDRRHL